MHPVRVLQAACDDAAEQLEKVFIQQLLGSVVSNNDKEVFN